MRQLTEEEATCMFAKLAKYIGENTEKLLTRDDQTFVFRLIKDRVYYMSAEVESCAVSMSRDIVQGAGILVGKFTHHKNFTIKITALPILAEYAQYKVWLTPAAELSYLYKNDVMRAHILRMSDGIPENAGVVIYGPDNDAVGFGVTTKSTVDAMRSDPSSKIVINQADAGEYLRDQDTLF